MKLFEKKARDERLVAETNRTYKIGFFVFTAGIGIDLLLSAFRDSAFPRFEWLVFMAAQIVCAVLNVRKGIVCEDADAECDILPLKKYLLISCAVGAGTGLLSCAMNALRYWQNLSFEHILIAAGATFVFVFFCTAVLTMMAVAVTFYCANRRRDADMRALLEEEERKTLD